MHSGALEVMGESHADLHPTNWPFHKRGGCQEEAKVLDRRESRDLGCLRLEALIQASYAANAEWGKFRLPG